MYRVVVFSSINPIELYAQGVIIFIRKFANILLLYDIYIVCIIYITHNEYYYYYASLRKSRNNSRAFVSI